MESHSKNSRWLKPLWTLRHDNALRRRDEFLDDAVALEPRQIVNEQLAVEVIHLVLYDRGENTVEILFLLSAFAVERRGKPVAGAKVDLIALGDLAVVDGNWVTAIRLRRASMPISPSQAKL